MSAFISIVMPLFNKAESVVASVRSVQDQTISAWELIVVDDGSTDGGAELVAALCDERIRIVTQANAGVSLARNAGAIKANCALIAFLDADDLWQPEFLESILALRRDYPEAGMYATCYDIVQPSGTRYRCRVGGMPEKFYRGLLPAYFRIAAISDPPVCSSAVAIDRETFGRVGGFPSGIISGEDLLTWARFAIGYPLAYDSRSLAVHMVSDIERPADPSFKVGAALESLWRKNAKVPGLKQYVALWWRMQATMALRFNELQFSRQLALRSLKYDWTNFRSFYVLVMACLPARATTVIDRILRRALARGRET